MCKTILYNYICYIQHQENRKREEYVYKCQENNIAKIEEKFLEENSQNKKLFLSRIYRYRMIVQVMNEKPLIFEKSK